MDRACRETEGSRQRRKGNKDVSKGREDRKSVNEGSKERRKGLMLRQRGERHVERRRVKERKKRGIQACQKVEEAVKLQVKEVRKEGKAKC